jgi:uncharacterized repeat protein (TIGR03803 family)
MNFKGANGANFAYPSLVQNTDGNSYGTTAFGETVFKNTGSGKKLTTLYSFDGASGSYPNALVQATNVDFYGTTSEGGNGHGTVFKVTLGGALTALYSFCSQSNCPDGADPYAGLIQATDGDFYGTTSAGEADNSGTVFKITPRGTLTTLYSFCSQSNCTDGGAPTAGLVQAADGDFYGTTNVGGPTTLARFSKSTEPAC